MGHKPLLEEKNEEKVQTSFKQEGSVNPRDETVTLTGRTLSLQHFE